MKTMKRLVAITLAAVMVFAMGSMAMAADPSKSDTGSITINGLTEGVTATAYQIAKATYDDSDNFLGYEMTVTVAGGWSIGVDGSWDDPSETQLAALYAALGGAAASGSATVSMGATSATITGLPVGSYLIVITGSESVAYGMMIGSVSYDVDETTGDWIVSGGSFAVSDCELWAKATRPSLGKTEHHTDGDPTHGESANVGDEITFDITISNIPSYQGSNPEFDVDDKLTGLVMSQSELAGMTVKIMNGSTTVATLVKGTDYTVEAQNSTGATTGDDIVEFDVNFVVNGKYMLNSYAVQGYTILIEYQATVSDDAQYSNGEAEYDNDATLTYATTSYAVHSSGANEGTSEDDTYEYTFALDATKTDGTDPLAGAIFGLYTDASCRTAYTQNGEEVTATSAEDGTISFAGLAEGTYYMKENKAPAGYLLSTAVYTVQISASYGTNGKITTWSITITDVDGNQVASVTQTADTGLTIINTKAGLLPSMGGRGTLLFTLIGGAIVACALIGVVATRKRRAA